MEYVLNGIEIRIDKSSYLLIWIWIQAIGITTNWDSAFLLTYPNIHVIYSTCSAYMPIVTASIQYLWADLYVIVIRWMQQYKIRTFANFSNDWTLAIKAFVIYVYFKWTNGHFAAAIWRPIWKAISQRHFDWVKRERGTRMQCRQLNAAVALQLDFGFHAWFDFNSVFLLRPIFLSFSFASERRLRLICRSFFIHFVLYSITHHLSVFNAVDSVFVFVFVYEVFKLLSMANFYWNWVIRFFVVVVVVLHFCCCYSFFFT